MQKDFKYKKKIHGLDYRVKITYNTGSVEYNTCNVQFYAFKGRIVLEPVKGKFPHLLKVLEFVRESVEEFVIKNKVNYVKFEGVRNSRDEHYDTGIITKLLIRYISNKYSKDCILFPEGKAGDIVYVDTHKALPGLIPVPKRYAIISRKIATYKEVENNIPIKAELDFHGYRINCEIENRMVGRISIKVLINEMFNRYEINYGEEGEKSFKDLQELSDFIDSILSGRISL